MKSPLFTLITCLLASQLIAEDLVIHQMFHHEKQCHFLAPEAETEFHKRKKINDKYLDRGEVFVGNSEASEDTSRLFRWHHPEYDIYFIGFELPQGIQGLKVDTFEVYVWKKKQPGLVPIYGSVASNGTDAYFTADPDKHKQKIRDDWKSKKARRRDLKVVFYAKPVSDVQHP